MWVYFWFPSLDVHYFMALFVQQELQTEGGEGNIP